jgi:hypothetical protein
MCVRAYLIIVVIEQNIRSVSKSTEGTQNQKKKNAVAVYVCEGGKPSKRSKSENSCRSRRTVGHRWCSDSDIDGGSAARYEGPGGGGQFFILFVKIL